MFYPLHWVTGHNFTLPKSGLDSLYDHAKALNKELTPYSVMYALEMLLTEHTDVLASYLLPSDWRDGKK